MEKSIITFSANEQNLQKTGGIGCYASDTVSYIEAHFTLGENWSGYDSIRAVWFNDYKTLVTVLNPNGICIVPHEVLTSRGKVMVNLVGSVLVSDELKDRLTTFPCEALKVSAKAKISGSETAEITPSQFEQFVSIVISEVEKVTGMTAQAETLPAGSQATARYENGILYLGIPQGIQGERGETGADGADGNGIASVVYNADYSLTLIFDNGERFTTPPIRGERGPAGADGRDGADGADGVTPNLSIGNVETLEPSEDAYVTRRGTDANPIFDFGIPKGDDGTVPDLDLILPTDTASGDIVSIPDGQSVVPVKSLKVTLEPIQDLHGYDKPWAGGSGANKWDEEWEQGGINISNGAMITSINQIRSKNYCAIIPNTTYYATCQKTDGGNQNKYYLAVIFYDDNKTFIRGVWANNLTFTPPENARYFKISTNSGTVIYGGTYNHDIAINYPSTVTTYSPYSNICPISGRTEVVTSVRAVNIWDEEWEIGGINASTGATDSSADRIRTKNFVPCKEGTSYYFACPSANWRMFFYDANKTFVSYIGTYNSARAITIPNGVAFLKFWIIGTTYNNDISINYPSTDHEYHAYNGTTHTTDLGRTVYGGTLDVVSGELVVDRAIVTIDNTNDIALTSSTPSSGTRFIVRNVISDSVGSNYISNMYTPVATGTGISSMALGQFKVYENDTNGRAVVVDEVTTVDALKAKLAQTPLTICYELATPQTYQLDPQTISLLHGNNNVWSDGSVEVTYNADVGLYIDKKLGTSGTSTLSMTRTLAKTDETKTDDTESELTKSDNIQLAED